MDPVTAIAIASTAFNAIKKGIAFGKEVESMSGDIGRWMNAIGSIKEAEKKAKNPPVWKSLFDKQSVEQEAIDAFAARKKAEAMEYELKTFISFEYGPNAWNEILSIQAQIRKQRKIEKEKQDDVKEQIIIWSMVGVAVLIFLGIVYFVIINL